MVFNRRTGQRDPVIASDRARRTRLLALGVLDVLGLVQDHPRPLNLAEGLDIALQEGVTGQHHVVAARSVAKGLALGALDPVMDHHAKTGGEARRLVLPVGYERGSGASCPIPYRQPGRRPTPSGAGSSTTNSLSPDTDAGCR